MRKDIKIILLILVSIIGVLIFWIFWDNPPNNYDPEIEIKEIPISVLSIKNCQFFQNDDNYWSYYSETVAKKIFPSFEGYKDFKNTETVAKITILRNGKLLNQEIFNSKGNGFIKRKLLNALKSEKLFPSLPKEFKGDRIDFYISFNYFTNKINKDFSMVFVSPILCKNAISQRILDIGTIYSYFLEEVPYFKGYFNISFSVRKKLNLILKSLPNITFYKPQGHGGYYHSERFSSGSAMQFSSFDYSDLFDEVETYQEKNGFHEFDS